MMARVLLAICVFTAVVQSAMGASSVSSFTMYSYVVNTNRSAISRCTLLPDYKLTSCVQVARNTSLFTGPRGTSAGYHVAVSFCGALVSDIVPPDVACGDILNLSWHRMSYASCFAAQDRSSGTITFMWLATPIQPGTLRNAIFRPKAGPSLAALILVRRCLRVPGTWPSTSLQARANGSCERSSPME